MITFEEATHILSSLIPVHLAEDWDNPGPQLGLRHTSITKILVALDLNNEVLDEAFNLGVQLIITHHPLFFRPITHIVDYTKKETLIYKLIQNNICVYSAHTNLDVLFFKELPQHFNVNNILPLKKSDIDPSLGLGSYGVLPASMSLAHLVEIVQNRLSSRHLKVVGDLNKKVQTIAFCGGTGSGFINEKYKALGLDVLVTADIKYHDAQKAQELDLALIDAGHFATENIMMKELEKLLRTKIKENIYLSKIITDPFLDTKEAE